MRSILWLNSSGLLLAFGIFAKPLYFQGMHEEIISYLREHPEGTASETVAETFLKFKSPDKKLAHLAVKAILSKDSRAFLNKDGKWNARAITTKNLNISDLPWCAVHLLTNGAKKIVHLSVWEISSSVNCLACFWMTDPAEFSQEDRDLLCDSHDPRFRQQEAIESFNQVLVVLSTRIPVFLSHDQYSILSYNSLETGSSIDSYYLVSHLFKALDRNTPRPLHLDRISEYLNLPAAPQSAYRQGEQFGRIVSELLTELKSKGIEFREQLDSSLQESNADFSQKAFTLEEIKSLPESPGVYGFKDKTGSYIYIGKAGNVRRRIQSYFRINEESPRKLNQLRQSAHSFTVHRCGSELEALLYEYRLIVKYQPPLNKQINISERAGNYISLEDSILLLPHSDPEKCMSFWIKKQQKIKMREILDNLTDKDKLLAELEEFFFSDKLSVQQDDIPELEIVTRWVKRNTDSLVIVPAGTMGSAEEITEAIRGSIKEVKDQVRKISV